MTNMIALKEVFSDVRASMATFNPAEENIYEFYRWFVQDAAARGMLAPAKPVDQASELRSSLNVAARAAQQFGATPAQINYIVSMAIQNDRFDVLSGGRLTKAEASHIIDAMKN